MCVMYILNITTRKAEPLQEQAVRLTTSRSVVGIVSVFGKQGGLVQTTRADLLQLLSDLGLLNFKKKLHLRGHCRGLAV